MEENKVKHSGKKKDYLSDGDITSMDSQAVVQHLYADGVKLARKIDRKFGSRVVVIELFVNSVKSVVTGEC